MKGQMAFIGLIIIIFISSCVVTGLGDASKGSRIGTLVKFSEKGWLWKTWEGELAIGSLKQNIENEFGSYVFEFSICDKDKDTISFIEQNLGERIKINYESPFLYFSWNQKSPYCVEEISKI